MVAVAALEPVDTFALQICELESRRLEECMKNHLEEDLEPSWRMSLEIDAGKLCQKQHHQLRLKSQNGFSPVEDGRLASTLDKIF